MCPTPRRCRGFQSSRILLQGVALKGRQIQPCHGRGFNFRGLYRSKTINEGTEPFSKSSLDKAGTQFSWNWPICYFGEQLCPGLNGNMKKFKVLLRGIFSPSGSRTRLRGTTWTFQGSRVKGYASRDSCPSSSKLGSRDHLDFREDSLLPKIVVFATH